MTDLNAEEVIERLRGEGMWQEGDFYELAYLLSDLLYGGELAYERFSPKEFRSEVRKRYELLRKDAAFYRSCALSGEIPEDGAEPSAQGR